MDNIYCPVVTGVQARISSNNETFTSQRISLSIGDGFSCLNSDQQRGFPCVSYEIRKCCECPPGNFLNDGKCEKITYSICKPWGDPHVVTFDGAQNDVYGQATYILTQFGYSNL